MPEARFETRREAVQAIFAGTLVHILRKEASRNRDWAALYGGFRPDSLTLPLFQRGALAFANSEKRLLNLCAVFLDSLGAPQNPELSARFAAAAAIPDLKEEQRDLCSALSQVNLLDLPPVVPAEHKDASPSLAVAPEPSSKIDLAPSEADPPPSAVRPKRSRKVTPVVTDAEPAPSIPAKD
ncbi:MAG: hypothetical protein EXR58_05285 [Chloroflexi bacterium]|nr:hypothetical protein [Chloroflexota bacterium]